MLDTTPVTTAITRLISAGTTEQALLVAVAQLFPELTAAEAIVGPAGCDRRGGEDGDQTALIK
jgi:hypothetical protein